VPFRKTLDRFGAEVPQMEQEVDAYLDSLKHLVKADADLQPRKTQTLERLFNRANVQVMFTGRRTLTTLDLYLSIMAETNSHAHYFLLKYGVTKAEFVKFWEQNYKHGDVKITNQQATEILEEHCTNITDQAKKDQLEPVIGREKDIEERHITENGFSMLRVLLGQEGASRNAFVFAKNMPKIVLCIVSSLVY
jgi:ATP-dependent Clp protease ATP-binding subunit ClpA